MCLWLIFLLSYYFTNVQCAFQYGLCTKENISCSHQLWPNQNKHLDACRMFFHNSTRGECVEQKFTENYNSEDYGYVKVQPFRNDSRTAFNITLHEIKWPIFRMRFKRRNGPENMCRSFHIDENELTNESMLYYDCPWSDAAYENQVVDFQYEYGRDQSLFGRKFVFYVPLYENVYKDSDICNISKLHLFTYVDTSDLDNLILRIKAAPKNCNITTYRIRVLLTRNNMTHKQFEKNVTSFDLKYGELQFAHKTKGLNGKYIFEVMPNHQKCEILPCNSVKTPGVIIPKNTTALTVAIVGMSVILIPIIFAVLYIWKKQCAIDGEMFRNQQKILLVYTPSNDAHVNVVKVLATLLRDTYNTNVMIDIFNVPSSKSKDPFLWFQDAFNCATHVVFLLSPKQNDSTQTIYKDIDNLAVHMMKEELSRPTISKSFSVLIFPYSQEEIPTALNNLKCFYFKKDFDAFLNFLLRKNFWEKLEESVHILKPELYIQLIDAVKVAENNARNEINVEGKLPEFIIQKETQIISLNTFDNTNEENNETDNENKYFYNIHDVLDNDKEESDVPDDEGCNLFDVHDLNLNGD